VVALGGGTGLSTLLRGLKEYVFRRTDEHPSPQRPIADLAAIVTVTDDGGSSGRLRRENRILPPGDIRNCMVALSKDEALLARLFQYRFHAGRGLIGHSFGNLFLAALTHVTGDFTEAIRVSSGVLAVRGRIFPSTLSNVHLVASLENGRTVHGETRITASRAPIRKVSLSPRRVRPLPKAIEAIKQADLILLGPGSLYTSILPNLLIPEIAAAIAKSKAPRVYIANLMTQPGETTGYALADHLRAIGKHVPHLVIDWVVANRQAVSPAPSISHDSKSSASASSSMTSSRSMGSSATTRAASLASSSKNFSVARNLDDGLLASAPPQRKFQLRSPRCRTGFPNREKVYPRQFS
jgi:uncharacterized cofD-like protein